MTRGAETPIGPQQLEYNKLFQTEVKQGWFCVSKWMGDHLGNVGCSFLGDIW